MHQPGRDFLRQVNVPSAQMEEILPAARLLRRATAVTPLDYERAKQGFLAHVDRAGVASAELGRQACPAAPGVCSRARALAPAVMQPAAMTGVDG